MAQYPCSYDGLRYVGRQQTFYTGVVKGSEQRRQHLRLCPVHFSAVQDHLAQFKVDPTDGTCPWFGSGAKCVTCLEPMDEIGWQFFGTSYPTNEEREDYWGGLHDGCTLTPILSLNYGLTGARAVELADSSQLELWPLVQPLPSKRGSASR